MWSCVTHVNFDFFSSSSKSILQRKGSQDLPASEYYAIYQQSKKNSVTNKPNEELKDLSTAAAISAEGSADETMEKSQAAEVKVQGGGIAER